ncbi:hypothetical protein [Lysobacter gummosus]
MMIRMRRGDARLQRWHGERGPRHCRAHANAVSGNDTRTKKGPEMSGPFFCRRVVKASR